MIRTVQLVQRRVINIAVTVQPAQTPSLHLALDRQEVFFIKSYGGIRLGLVIGTRGKDTIGYKNMVMPWLVDATWIFTVCFLPDRVLQMD